MGVNSQSSPKRVDTKSRLAGLSVGPSGCGVCFLAQVDIDNPTAEQQGNTHPGQDEAVAEMTIIPLLGVLEDLFSLESVDQDSCKCGQT